MNGAAVKQTVALLNNSERLVKNRSAPKLGSGEMPADVSLNPP